MTWTRLSDDFPDREAVWRLSDAAFRLHISALVFCNRLLTDGRLPTERVRVLTPNVEYDAIRELTDSGLWEITSTGYQLVDFNGDQPTAASVKRTREKAKERFARWAATNRKKGKKRNAVANGVGNARPVPVLPTEEGSAPPRQEGAARSDAKAYWDSIYAKEGVA